MGLEDVVYCHVEHCIACVLPVIYYVLYRIISMLDNQGIGNYGERATWIYLQRNGHYILDTNVRLSIGEIDIISQKHGIIHFIEVKSVSYETKQGLEESYLLGEYKPEERVNHEKRWKLKQLILLWLQKNDIENEYQFDIASVYLVPREKLAVVDMFENVKL